MANNKTLLWVGIGSAVLIGGGVAWWMYSKNKAKGDAQKKKKEDEEKPPTKTEETKIINEPVSQPYTPPKVTNTQPKPSTLPATPFANQTEGNAFRLWMKQNHSDWRYKNDTLGEKGEYDNEFIRKAYKDYGAEYEKSIKAVAQAKSDAEAKKKAQADAILNSFNAVQTNLQNDKKVDTLYNTAVERYTNRIFADFVIDKGAFVSETRYGAIFYNNSRFVLKQGNADIKLGTYYNGGRKIVLDNGRIIESSSIWSNIVTSVDA